MFWDIRARALVYELSTGNNAVHSLAWDSGRTTLYAATARMDDKTRNARVPEIFKTRDQEDHDGLRDEAPETDVRMPDTPAENYKDGTRFHNATKWPKKAYHPEGYFGYCYDAGVSNISMSTNLFVIVSALTAFGFPSELPVQRRP